MSPRRFVSWVTFALALAAYPDGARAGETETGHELAARAHALGIARSVAWRRLLHARAGAWGGVVSEVDGSDFFLSRSGKHDPEAELDATITAFFAPPVPGREDRHAICRFPARLLFLDSELHFSHSLPQPACPALARYEAEVDVTGAAIVFAANYLNRPASAFGHTFLRLRRRRPQGSTEPSERIDFGVDFIAKTDTKNPVFYAFKGLTGLFPGTVRRHTYEEKLREYGHEDRDVWEYDLGLTPHELRMLTLHLWELDSTHIDYYYLTRNCSYEILALLEAAAPRIDVLDQLDIVVVPADTIKALRTVPDLVGNVAFRPALDVARRADGAPPHEGHGSMRVTLGTGATSQYGTAFGTLGYRLVLHDLADPPRGEPELSEVQFFDVRMRLDMERRAVTLDRLTFAEVFALNPITRRDHALSWRVEAFGVRLHDRDCPDGFAHGLDGSLGATIATRDARLAVFLLADAYVGFSGSLDGIAGSFVRVGLGPFGGLRVRLPLETVGLVTGSLAYLPGERLTGTYDVRAALRSEIARDAALGIEAAVQPLSAEASFNAYLFF